MAKKSSKTKPQADTPRDPMMFNPAMIDLIKAWADKQKGKKKIKANLTGSMDTNLIERAAKLFDLKNKVVMDFTAFSDLELFGIMCLVDATVSDMTPEEFSKHVNINHLIKNPNHNGEDIRNL